MAGNKKHLFVTEWTRIARDIEDAFFQIEEKSKFWGAVVNGLIAGIAVGCVAFLASHLREGDLILFACLGSSAASIVFAPMAKVNSLRSIILAYVIATIVCGLLFPIHRYEILPIEVQCCFAVALPVTAMRLLDAMHPSAIGSSLAFIIYDRQIQGQLILLLAIIGLLFIVKVLAYAYLRELRFADFPREFTREYFGRETVITVTGTQDDPKDDPPAT